MNDHMDFQPLPAPDLTGAERFKGLDSTLQEFWSYAARDLRSNIVRGVLAEWLVAKAIGATELLPEWHEFDVLTPAGIRVEVKSSAYLQAWPQRRLSTITFGGLNSEKFDAEMRSSGRRTFNADVYVFCVQTARSHDSYDPLDVSQWDFYVLPRSRVQSIGQRSVGLTRITSETEPVDFDGLHSAVNQAAKAPVRIVATRGDIVTAQVDAIVTSANKSMRGGGGVDMAVHRVGGREILAHCIERFPNGLPTGEAGWTTAGDLSSHWLIHAIGPNYTQGYTDPELLRSAYRRALEVANELRATSVAFPLLSTGVYGWPKKDAIRIAVETVREYAGDVAQVQFFCWSEDDYDLVSAELSVG